MRSWTEWGHEKALFRRVVAAAATGLALAFFIGIHFFIDRLAAVVLHGYPRLLAIANATFGVGFLLVYLALVLEMVGAFIPRLGRRLEILTGSSEATGSGEQP